MNSLAPFLIEKYAGIDQQPNTLSAVEDSPSEQPRDNQVPEIIYESVCPRQSNVSLEEYGIRLEENISYGQITNSQ